MPLTRFSWSSRAKSFRKPGPDPATRGWLPGLGWLVVRLERYAPATFTDEVSDQMCQEMFDARIAEQTTASLSQLASETKDQEPTSDFSDFSISR